MACDTLATANITLPIPPSFTTYPMTCITSHQNMGLSQVLSVLPLQKSLLNVPWKCRDREKLRGTSGKYS